MADTVELRPVDWSAVQTLAIAVGVREAARRLGLSEEMVKKRCTREGWLDNPAVREAAKRSVQERSGSVALSPHTSPMAVMAQELLGLGMKTRVSIARGMAKAATTVEQMDGDEILISANNVKAVAQTAAIVHGWAANAPQPKIRLELVNMRESEPITIEAESEVMSTGAWDSELDEY